ncbi:GNAT family N-acetyltransferase [Algoriphagus aestuarii]|nr:GNAT family N-acetyltransferase [Algoriphagus aestuarii]
MEFSIREATLEEVFQIHQQIAEFYEPISEDFYSSRLKTKKYLALVAEANGKLLGFKVGYHSKKPHILYSWMGGVKPEFRKIGVATALAEVQENWARKQGYKKVYFKTRNRFPAMINFGLKRGFQIVKVIPKGGMSNYRVLMMKSL